MNHRPVDAWLLVALCLLAFTGRAGAQATTQTANFRQDVAALSSEPSRIIGSPGYDKAAAYLETQIRSLGSSVELRRHEFAVMMPETESATVEVEGVSHRIYPFWPAGVRVNAAPTGGLRGRAVYCGDGSLAQIKPNDVRGQIAVIESSAGQAWKQVAYFGARAVIVLGSDATTNVDLREHEVLLPANLPRFYVPSGELADRLRQGAAEVTINCRVSWRPARAVNLYALVKPRAPPDATKTGPAALLVSAGYESSSLVPDLAPGASQAVQPAAALAVLRQFAARPPPRPVVVAFVGADSIQLLGQRQMFMALADAPAQWRRRRAELEQELAGVEQDAAALAGFGGDLTKLSNTDQRRLVDRLIKSVETRTALVQDELFRLRRITPAEQSPTTVARRQALEGQNLQLGALRIALQTDPKRLGEPNLVNLSKELAGQMTASLAALQQSLNARKSELTGREDLYQWLATATGRNPDPAERDVSQRLIELHIGLDLSDAGSRVGPMFFGQAYRTNASVNLQDFRDWAARVQREHDAAPVNMSWWADVRKRFDFEPLSQIRAPQSYLSASMALPTEVAQAWGIPAMSWITLDDLRLRRDTPNDALERLDIDAIEPQLQSVLTLIDRAWNDPRFISRVEPKRQRQHIDGQVVSPSAGRPVPDLPRDGFVVSYYHTMNATRRIPQMFPIDGYPYAMGLRRSEVLQTDPLGRYRIEGLPQINTRLSYILPQAYRIVDRTGAIDGTSDLGKQLGELKQYADIRQDVPTQRLLVFNCEEFALVGLYDPRFLQDLSEVVPIDARRNAEPQRYNLLVGRQLLAGFFEPGSTAQLLFRYGRVGNRLILLNMSDRPDGKALRGAGEGFSIANLRDIGPLNFATARDFWRLDEQRLAEYRKAGVSSALIDSLHESARKQLEAAERAMAENDAVEFTRQANGAWANEARVYDATRALASDVVRAAIFLLILLAPFSFCMERLLIGTPNVYKQIGWTALIFAVMTALLWSFHPAFKISSSPLIIILAFAIILMSAIVIWVIYGKFDTEIKRIKSRRGTSDGASIARASVLMSAVLLGIANMRKRKLRTALTSLTIVLITFAVLWFTSATTYVGTTNIITGQSSTHPGILLRQRGFRALPVAAVENFAASLGPGVRVAERWWNVSPIDPRDQITLSGVGDDGSAGESVGVVLLGLSPGESRLSRIADVIGVDRFARLENGELDVIFLSDVLAGQIGVAEGGTVVVGGLRLRVAGVFSADEFDQKVTMLSGESIAPLKYSMNMLDASGRRLDDSAAESVDVDPAAAAAEAGGAYEHLPASQFAIVPAAVSRMLPNASLRNVAFRLEDQKQVEQVSDELARRFGLAMFAGYDDGVRLIAASNLADVSGGAKVAIPLLLGGMIIFNTMMGSIAERKREIHVYTSLGLAPLHVGALFVAEAMTYGLIGTVFGYIAGQSVGTLLSRLDWLGGATLNYSGSSAMMTMGLILAVVFISALVPARMASKVAAPSIDRNWKVPRPQGDAIRAVLPFTINHTAAEGVLAYLNEYFEDHREGSIGKFSADDIQLSQQEDQRTLSAAIWLTPFDLGVRQDMTISIQPSGTENIYEVHVRLIRESGDDDSWYRMNRPFLTELRKQFLAWRSLAPAEMQRYVEIANCRLPIAN